MESDVSYLVVLSTACASASFLLTIMNLVMWLLTGRQAAYLFAAIMVTAAGFLAIVELRQIGSPSIENYVEMSRIAHVLLFAMMVSLVMFVRAYLNAGPRWLIGVIALCWGISVIQSMVMPYSVVYAEVTEMVQSLTYWGEAFWTATGPVNPGKYVADVGVVLTLVFLAMSVAEASRTGRSGRAALVGGSAVLFLVSAGAVAILQDIGLISVPLFTPMAFSAIIGALSYRFVDDAFKARDAALEVAQLRRVITLGEMVGGITHEINQPLSAILNNAQAAKRFLAAKDFDIDTIREILDDIVLDGKRASDNIHGIRRMLTRDAIKGTRIEVGKVVSAASNLVKGELHARDVSLRVVANPQDSVVAADEAELTQVLVNLLLNAIRAAAGVEKGDRIVNLAFREDAATGHFAVEDRGPGIDDDLMGKLFEPFVSRSEGGLGIGLSVCKRIIERSNGRIWAEQREGGGAVFHVSLPLATEEAS